MSLPKRAPEVSEMLLRKVSIPSTSPFVKKEERLEKLDIIETTSFNLCEYISYKIFRSSVVFNGYVVKIVIDQLIEYFNEESPI